jgi:hypothetical protein
MCSQSAGLIPSPLIFGCLPHGAPTWSETGFGDQRFSETLLEYFPALERAFDCSKSKAALTLLSRYQTPDNHRRLIPPGERGFWGFRDIAGCRVVLRSA